jgi:hypothetical protein
MTASGGLQSDARRAVYEEDVVTYADDDTAEEWGDPQNYSATAVGLVSRVAGSDDEWSSDEEPEEVRTNDVGFRARFELVSRRDDDIAARSTTRTNAPATRVDSEPSRAPPTRRRSRATSKPSSSEDAKTQTDKTHRMCDHDSIHHWTVFFSNE